MKPPTVLEVRVVTATGGGPDKTILLTPKFLRPHGYRVLCAYLYPPDDPGFATIQQRAATWEAPLLALPDRGLTDFSVVWRLLRICQHERVAIWHGHDYKSNVLGLLISAFVPLRLVTTVHGWVRQTRRTPWYYALDRLSIAHYERVMCVSEDLAAQVRRIGVGGKRCLLLENGIDTEFYRRSLTTVEARQRLGWPLGRLVVGAVGRLSPEKGFAFLIAAISHLLQIGWDVELRILGEGDARPKLEQQIERLGVRDRIHLLGHGDPIPFYQGLDLLVLSSLREGLPNVLLEAMALETPVIAAPVGGVHKLVRPGENGWLLDRARWGEKHAVELLVGDLIEALAQPLLRAHFARTGRQTIETHFSMTQRMAKVARVFDEVLHRRRPTHGNGVIASSR